MAAFDTFRSFRRLTSSGMEEPHAEAVVDVVGEGVTDRVTRDDLRDALDLTVAQLTAEFQRGLRVQGAWIVGAVVGLMTIVLGVFTILGRLAG